ncbi:MAG: hypothetical protein IPJ13_00375 [Saprospiraceae bacterium]|nr:hypothetical protein [Saprospiraceae bacterium]
MTVHYLKIVCCQRPLETISQAEILKEIVDFTYKTYPETDTLLAAVITCNNEKRLYIQTEGTPNYDFCSMTVVVS